MWNKCPTSQILTSCFSLRYEPQKEKKKHNLKSFQSIRKCSKSPGGWLIVFWALISIIHVHPTCSKLVTVYCKINGNSSAVMCHFKALASCDGLQRSLSRWLKAWTQHSQTGGIKEEYCSISDFIYNQVHSKKCPVSLKSPVIHVDGYILKNWI